MIDQLGTNGAFKIAHLLADSGLAQTGQLCCVRDRAGARKRLEYFDTLDLQNVATAVTTAVTKAADGSRSTRRVEAELVESAPAAATAPAATAPAATAATAPAPAAAAPAAAALGASPCISILHAKLVTAQRTRKSGDPKRVGPHVHNVLNWQNIF